MVRIAELAARTGVSPRRLRHYEAHGLLAPARDARGWRDYAIEDVFLVEAIDALVGSGIPVDLALQVFRSREHGSARDDVGDEVLDAITAYFRQLDARVRCLQRNRDALAGWLATHGIPVTGATGSAAPNSPTLDGCPTTAAPPT